MNVFTRHPHEQGVTYFEHWIFAMGIAGRLLCGVLSFAMHALLPFISIEPRFDLEATSAFLLERNDYIETTAASAHGKPVPGEVTSNAGRHNTPAWA